MAKKGGLGKGLDALIPGASPETESDGGSTFVSIDKISPNPHQPRQQIEDKELSELAASIKEHGILQPLIVTHDPELDHYILIAGERRLRAAKIANLDFVPVLIRQVTEQQRLELALIENVQRADLSPLETADAYHQLNFDFGLSHETISLRVGKSRVSVTNTLRLLNLPDDAREALARGTITEGHARALLGSPTPQALHAALEKVIQLDLTVRQTEELVRNYSGEKTPSSQKPNVSAEIYALEESLRTHLGTKVSLRHGKKGGNIIIHYYSGEELTALVTKIIKE
jgi:ParB family chromosome partitioning protein